MTTSRQRESNLWKHLQRHLKTQNRIDYQRVENQVSNSMPDVYFSSDENGGTTGWMELKVMHATTKADRLFIAPHFSTGQRRWIKREWLRGARPFLLVERVGRQGSLLYLLTAEAAEVPFPWTREVFNKYAIFNCDKREFGHNDVLMRFLDVLVGKYGGGSFEA